MSITIFKVYITAAVALTLLEECFNQDGGLQVPGLLHQREEARREEQSLLTFDTVVHGSIVFVHTSSILPDDNWSIQSKH